MNRQASNCLSWRTTYSLAKENEPFLAALRKYFDGQPAPSLWNAFKWRSVEYACIVSLPP